MNAAPPSPVDAKAARRAKLELVVHAALPVWARAVLVIIGGAMTAHLAGVGEAAGFALIPGIYMALSPPVGRRTVRIETVFVATAFLIVAVIAGAVVAGSTVALTVALVIVGFAIGLAPRFGPRWAALQLPLMTAFVYSAAFPPSTASIGSRVVAVLVAVPVYLLACALLFQSDARRPLLLGAAHAFGGLAQALRRAAAGETEVGHDAEVELVAFRVATGRLKDAALPLDDTLDSRAARVVVTSVQQAVTATELLAGDETAPIERDDVRRTRLTELAAITSALGAAFADPGPAPDPVAPATLARAAQADGDEAVSLLGDALAAAASAIPVLRGDSDVLPERLALKVPGPWARLRGVLSTDDPTFRRAVRLAVAVGAAGLTASLLDLTRIYWAVFAVVVILNAPAAKDWRRAVMRIAGTVAGFVLALALVALVGDNGVLALTIGLMLLFGAMVAMPLNYGIAVVFITSTVGMMFAITDETADFLRYRIVDNLLGVAIVCGVGLVLLRTTRADWWRVAAMTAGTLGDTAAADEPVRRRDALATRLIQLRTETVEAAALPDMTAAYAPTWTYLAAAEDLTRTFVGPDVTGGSVPDGAALAARLRDVERRCATNGRATDARTTDDDPAEAPPRTRAALDVTRMAGAVTLLHRAEQRA